MNDPYRGYVEAVVQMPNMGKLLRYRVDIDNSIAGCFSRLPRDRELAFIPESGRRARDQSSERRELASYLASTLADSILKAIESDDTKNGYEPEEWNRMHQAKVS